ncbi:MAG: hypothetical protein HQ517_14950 [SAR324 cluster bacterium]|nr:hypothetical protein [SAR324 cluster bacterium]
MVFRKALLLAILLNLSFSTPAAERSQKLTVGGLVRLGGFDLTKTAKESLATEVSYDEKNLENALGKFLFINYTHKGFGMGARWMTYLMEGENPELDQKLELTYSIITASYVFLEGDFLHPDLVSRFGFTLGAGQNRYKLTTKSNETDAVQTIDESITSIGTARLIELFFEAVTRSGWGYHLGYFAIDTTHSRSDSRNIVNGSTQPTGYLGIAWYY